MNELIKRSYYVFQRYRPHSPLEVCHGACCITPENLQKIYHTPIAKLLPSAIYDYLTAAGGDEAKMSDEIRYFVPRIFELLWQGEADKLHHSNELILSKLHLQEGIWHDDELELMISFAEGFFIHVITEAQYAYASPLSFIVMFHLAGLRYSQLLLDIWLKQLEHQLPDKATNVVKAFVNAFFNDIYYGYRYKNPFCSQSFAQEITDWFHSKSVAQAFIPPLLQLSENIGSDYHECFSLDATFDFLSANL